MVRARLLTRLLKDHATYADVRKYSSGTDYVIVNGKISVENGEYPYKEFLPIIFKKVIE